MASLHELRHASVHEAQKVQYAINNQQELKNQPFHLQFKNYFKLKDDNNERSETPRPKQNNLFYDILCRQLECTVSNTFNPFVILILPFATAALKPINSENPNIKENAIPVDFCKPLNNIIILCF